jgi:integrase
MPNPPKLLTVGNESLTLKEWSARPPHVPPTTIRARLLLKWTPQEAVSIPPDRRFRPSVKVVKGVARPCPKLRLHKGTGQAFCQWMTSGERHTKYFGKWQTEEAEQAYARFQLEWATRLVRRSPVAPGETVLVCELVEAWLDYCETGDDGESGYRKRGELTSEIHSQRAAMNYLTPAYGASAVDEFGPEQLRAVRKGMIDANLARRTINGYQTRIVQMFGWGVGRDLVPSEVWARLKQVGRLQKGKTTARDNPKRRGAPWDDVQATFPHLHKFETRRAVLESLIRVHWFLGGRSQDLVGMRAGDIDRTGDEWHYVVDGHKNEHREQELAYWIGPRCQAVLAPLLEGKGPNDLVFVYPPAAEGGPPTPIRRGVYAIRVKAACERAKVKVWTPHQLRHSRATEVMRIFESDEAAAAAIGDTPEVTRTIYVDPLDAIRKRIARETG